jgi:hypothetical protein
MRPLYLKLKPWMAALRSALLISLGMAALVSCQPSGGRDGESSGSETPQTSTGAPGHAAWDSLSAGLLDAWGLSAFWQKNTEECGYYETREIDGQQQTWTSVATLERAMLPAAPGAPSAIAWHYRYQPDRAAWSAQEGWFAAKPHAQPLSWTRSYPDSGLERFGDVEKGSPYAQRSFSLPDGRSGSEMLPQEILMADQLPFLLRSLVFSEGMTRRFALHPLSRMPVDYLPKALVLDLRVEGSEPVTFQDQEYPCWLVVLRAGQQTVERYWFDRRYPHVLVRWENVAGESRQLRYVRHHPIAGSHVVTP